MLALLSAILTASLLGSSHCAGMCGAFVAFAVASPDSLNREPPRWLRHVAYSGGRLVTYTLLGTIAGGLGAALDLGGSFVGLQRLAAIVAAAVMVCFGVIALLRAASVRIPRMPVPEFLVRLSRAAHNRAFDLPPVSRAAVVGLLTTLLPCGWLYAFVVTAAGTASPLKGAAVMAAFWLGTLPVIAAVGVGAQALTGPLRKHLPVLTSVLLVTAGMWTLCGRVTIPASAMPVVATPQTPEDAAKELQHVKVSCPLCNPGGEH